MNDTISHPREFLIKYKITQAELAEVLGVSIQLVKSWFAHSEPRQPEQRYLDRLCEIDALLEIQKIINTKVPPHIRRLFDLSQSNY
jgi:transcriptional regulator with XRE-family HTH domain